MMHNTVVMVSFLYAAGAYHASEISYMFGTPFLQQNDIAREYLEYRNITTNYTDEELQFSGFMMDLWTNFAKYGYVIC